MSGRQRVTKRANAQAASPFADPAEWALRAAMEKRDDGIDVANSIDETLPSIESGGAKEIRSLAMNETLVAAEVEFDRIYLPYPRHTHVQLQMDRVRLHGLKAKGLPLRGLRILGPTGSGKTTAIEEYAVYLAKSGRYADERAVPMVHVRLRKKATWTKVMRAILYKFGDRHAGKRDEEELNEQVRNCIQRGGTEILVIDECQHLKNLSTDSMVVTDELKVFLDESIVPVVFVGTYDAKVMFEANAELCGRLGEPVDLRPLRIGDDGDARLFNTFLAQLDAAVVERKLTKGPSGLDHPRTVACLHDASQGVIGQAFRVVRAALLISISRQADRIEPYDLALAVERWAIPNGVCARNPFRGHVAGVVS